MPPIENKQIKLIDFSDWDYFVQQTYGNDKYEIVSDQGYTESGIRSFKCVSKAPINDFVNDAFEEFKGGINRKYVTETILQDLVNRDILTPGEYYIQVYVD